MIGLGYVGLPLAVEFARAGVATIGFDIDAERTAAIARGDSYVADVKSDDLRSVVEGLTLSATTDFTELAGVDTINICVPTPLRKTRDPDLSTSSPRWIRWRRTCTPDSWWCWSQRPIPAR